MIVRLEDARGCWRLWEVEAPLPPSVLLPGYTWKSLPFHLTSDRDGADRRIYRARRPAIGPARAPFVASLYLPDDWHAPAGVVS